MMDVYDISMEVCGAIKNGSENDIESAWYQAFDAILASFGVCNRTDFFWNSLVAGNWKRLHLTADEEEVTKAEWLDKFYWEISYCSDRWSLDRLCRCHWLYRAWKGMY